MIRRTDIHPATPPRRLLTATCAILLAALLLLAASARAQAAVSWNIVSVSDTAVSPHGSATATTSTQGSVSPATDEVQKVTVDAGSGSFNLSFEGQASGAGGSGDLSAASTEVTGVLTSTGAFLPGEEVLGAGIPSATTIVAVGLGTLELSRPATLSATGVSLSAAVSAHAEASQLQQILEAVPSIGAGNLEVGGGPGRPRSRPLRPHFQGRPRRRGSAPGRSCPRGHAARRPAHLQPPTQERRRR